MNVNNYPALEQFLGAYFHQDFMLDSGSPDGAIAEFVQGSSADTIHEVCSELQQVIPMVEKMKDPEEFLHRTLWCDYLPSADGWTVAGWLKHVQQKVCSG